MGKEKLNDTKDEIMKMISEIENEKILLILKSFVKSGLKEEKAGRK